MPGLFQNFGSPQSIVPLTPGPLGNQIPLTAGPLGGGLQPQIPAADSSGFDFAGLFGNPALQQLLLSLSSGLLTPATSTGEVLGNTARGLLELTLSQQQQQQRDKLFQLEIDEKTNVALDKRVAKTGRARIAQKMIADPSARRSDLFLEEADVDPTLFDTAIELRALEDKQDLGKVEERQRRAALAQIFQTDPDPRVRGLLELGELGPASTLVRQRESEENIRTRPRRDPGPGFDAALDSLIRESGLTPEGRLPETFDDPQVESRARTFGAIAEAAVANKTPANLSRAFTALDRLNEAKSRSEREKEKDTIKAAEAQAKTAKEQEKERIRIARSTTGSLTELTDRYNTLLGIGKKGEALDNNFNFTPEELSLIKATARGKVETLNRSGVDAALAARHVYNKIIFDRLLHKKSLEDSLLEPGPPPEVIRELESLRGDPRFEDIKQFFNNKYGYMLLY
ncbi:MAG: hypothetical protein ACREBU_00325 [Nitrososphaera sp.]